jgi:peptidylprolyl isomerase
MLRRTLTAAVLAAAFATSAHAQQPADSANTVYMELKNNCRVTIHLRPDLAPKMVQQFKTLTEQGFYNGTPFHRVIDGFMAQGGDPTGTGTGGSKMPNVPAEFTNNAHFLTGTLGAARSADPNSANSQFFIMFDANSSLDGKYTIFGNVVAGMDCVKAIKRGGGSNGSVSDPDKIVRMQLATKG